MSNLKLGLLEIKKKNLTKTYNNYHYNLKQINCELKLLPSQTLNNFLKTYVNLDYS